MILVRFNDFNEISRKDLTLILLKATKNQSFILSLEDTFLEKTWGQIDPLAFLGLIDQWIIFYSFLFHISLQTTFPKYLSH